MAVQLRKKPLANGKISLYLDLYNGEERKYEFLRLYLYKRPKDELERQHNKEVQKTAETVRAKRELQAGAEQNDVITASKTKTNFLAYYERYITEYTKKDTRMLKAALKYLQEFVTVKKISTNGYLSARAITEAFCYDFKTWLDAHENLSGETPSDYFARFKKVLKHAVREKILPNNPAQDVINKRADRSLQKDVLTVEELQALAKAHCGNKEVKRAFLFACNTGLRFCDVVSLRWEHIQQGTIKLQQQKTGHFVFINLNSTAQKLLGKPEATEGPVFNLPSHTGLSKALRYWKDRAGISKKVTFHVARHSFATNLLIYETDVKTVSSLLGHSTLAHTQKYVRVVEALKQNAVNRLPEIEL